MKSNRLVVKLVGAAAALCVHGNGASAGFMDDLYTSAGAAANSTPAGVYATQSGRYVTGGSASWRVPSRDFQPFTFSPPRFTGGCGGIDFYGGSFGFVNGAEFVDYLKNLGQNATGLLFKMALKLVSPSLDAAIAEISDVVQKMNGSMKDSCTMAKTLLKGPQNWVDKMANDRAADAQAGGGFAGFFDAYKSFKDDFDSLLGYSQAPAEAVNSGGAPIGKAEQNVTWVAMNSGQFSNYSQAYINYVLSLMGTKVYHKVNGTDGKPTMHTSIYAVRLNVRDLAGHWHEAPTARDLLSCPMDASNPCLNPTFASVSHTSFARMAYDALRRLSNAILTRSPVGGGATYLQDIKTIGATSLPAFRMIEITTAPGMQSVNEAMVQKYADFMGLEAAANIVDTLAGELRKALAGGEGVVAARKLAEEDVAELEDRIRELQDQSMAIRHELKSMYSDQASLIQELEHLERSLQTNFSMRLASNIRYSASR